MSIGIIGSTCQEKQKFAGKNLEERGKRANLKNDQQITGTAAGNINMAIAEAPGVGD